MTKHNPNEGRNVSTQSSSEIETGKTEQILNLEGMQLGELQYKQHQLETTLSLLIRESSSEENAQKIEKIENDLKKIKQAIKKREEMLARNESENVAEKQEELTASVDEEKKNFDQEGKLTPEQEQAAAPEEKNNLNEIKEEANVITQQTRELLSKELGFMDIDPKEIFESLTKEDIDQLQMLMKGGEEVVALQKETEKLQEEYEKPKTGFAFNKEKKKEIEEQKKKIEEKIKEKQQQIETLKKEAITAFWKEKIKQIVLTEGEQRELTEEKAQKIAENLQAIIQQSLEAESQERMSKLDWGKGLKMAGNMAKNVGLMFGAAALISGLGIATGGIGVAVMAGGIALTRLVERKISGAIREKNGAKTEKKFKEKLENIKKDVLNDFFSDKDNLRKQISGIISNEIRKQSAKGATSSLREYEKTKEGKKEVMESRLSDAEKEFYVSALTKIKAEHPEIDEEQRHNMAVQMAMTLSMYERNENEAKKRLEDLKKNKPKVAALVQKFNLLQSGVPDKKPEGMTQEEETLWDKYKYDLLSLGIGTAVGVAARTSDLGRVILGTVSGIGTGYMLSEMKEKGAERKGLKEIEKMINESEKVIRDIEFPAAELPKLRENATLVQSRIDLGLLDTDPALKSRAENFIYNVKKIEIANQKALEDLLKQQKENDKKLEKQVERDVTRIEKKTKKRRLLYMVGGGALGFLTAGAFTKTGKGIIHKFFGSEDGGGSDLGKQMERKEGHTPKDYQTEQPAHPEQPPTQPGDAQPESVSPIVPEQEKVDLSDAIVHKGEGAEHALIRQLVKEPQKFGYEGDPTDVAAVKDWAGGEAHRIALDQGIVKMEGGAMHEIRTGVADKIAYQLENVNGEISVKEIDVTTGAVGAPETINTYEYGYTNPPAVHEAVSPGPDVVPIDQEAMIPSKLSPLDTRLDLNPETAVLTASVKENIDQFNNLVDNGGSEKEINKIAESLVNDYNQEPILNTNPEFHQTLSRALDHQLENVLEKGGGLFKGHAGQNIENIVKNITQVNGFSSAEASAFVRQLGGSDGIINSDDMMEFMPNGQFDSARLQWAMQDFEQMIHSGSVPISPEFTPRWVNLIDEAGKRSSKLVNMRMINNNVEVDLNNDGISDDIYNPKAAENIMKSFGEQEKIMNEAAAEAAAEAAKAQIASPSVENSHIVDNKAAPPPPLGKMPTLGGEGGISHLDEKEQLLQEKERLIKELKEELAKPSGAQLQTETIPPTSQPPENLPVVESALTDTSLINVIKQKFGEGNIESKSFGNESYLKHINPEGKVTYLHPDGNKMTFDESASIKLAEGGLTREQAADFIQRREVAKQQVAKDLSNDMDDMIQQARGKK